MTGDTYNTAIALKEEIRQVDILLANDPIKAPFGFARDFPTDLPLMAVLGQPALDDANATWLATLNDRKIALVSAFDALP